MSQRNMIHACLFGDKAPTDTKTVLESSVHTPSRSEILLRKKA